MISWTPTATTAWLAVPIEAMLYGYLFGAFFLVLCLAVILTNQFHKWAHVDIPSRSWAAFRWSWPAAPPARSWWSTARRGPLWRAKGAGYDSTRLTRGRALAYEHSTNPTTSTATSGRGRRTNVRICQTCAVEHAEAVELCAICADERQWVPLAGQRWTTLDELAAAGHQTQVRELEPDLFGITVDPRVGIGQQAHLVRTPAGNLLWDPTGYLDDHAIRRVRALGNVPMLVAEPNLEWVSRPAPAIRSWNGKVEVLPGVTLVQLGGHFPGSAVVYWRAGAGEKGVLLGSDTIQTNRDRASVTFMRSYPNRIPLSAGVVQRLAEAVEVFSFDRLYDNFGGTIDTDARAAVRRSADRYIGWIRGDFDNLT